ncbi:MAG: hypothetical protein M3Y82_11825 [Verrucomicrobiota bacterium]|nr:hypothetical protein [Verrucomicrobiota bacterium]
MAKRFRKTVGGKERFSYFQIVTQIEKEILQTLLDLESKIHSMKTANPKPNLLPVFARLDELARQLPKNIAPDLLHYLHKKSYEKARLFFQERETENARGNCRH